MNESDAVSTNQSPQSEFDVTQDLERLKREFKERIVQSALIGLKVDHVKRYGTGYLAAQYPNAVVSLVPSDAHLFPALLNVASELAPERAADYTEPPDKIAQHEGDHVFQLNQLGLAVKRYGILITTDKDNGILCYPFVSFDKPGFKDDLKITLAPLRHGKLSPEDTRELITLVPKYLSGKLRQLFLTK